MYDSDTVTIPADLLDRALADVSDLPTVYPAYDDGRFSFAEKVKGVGFEVRDHSLSDLIHVFMFIAAVDADLAETLRQRLDTDQGYMRCTWWFYNTVLDGTSRYAERDEAADDEDEVES